MSDEFTAVLDDTDVKNFIKGFQKKMKAIASGNNFADTLTQKYAGLLSAIVFKDVIQHFESESGSDGAWKAWSKSYRKQLEKIGREGNKILQFNGRLRQNFKPTSMRASAQGILWFNDAKTKGGFPYAAAHNYGGDKLPKRDFMWLSFNAMNAISEQTLQFMLDEGV